MSTYLKFFALERSPFDGEDQSKVVLGTRALRDALATIQTGLDEGAARICVSGDSGLGKTSLARALPKLLGETTRAALVLDPSKGWDALRGSLAKQWGIREGGLARARLIEASRDRRLVLVLDQSEKASEEFLDHLDVLLSYRTEEDEPVVQSVLLAHLGPDENGDMPPVVWWLDRIHTLQLEFAPLPRSGVESYIQKHLKRAGHGGGELFTSEAAQAIHGYTGGVPGQIGRLCEELLEEAASQNLATVDAYLVHEFCEPSKTAVDETADAPVDDCAAPPEEPQPPQARDDEVGPVQVDRHVAVGADRTLELIDEADRTSDDEADPGDDRTESYGYAGHDGSVGSAGEDPSWDEPHEGAYGQEVPPLRATDAIEDEIDEESGDEVAGTLESVAEDEDREGVAEETGEHADEREAFEQFLAQPATEAELRAIRGGGFTRYAKAVGGVAAAAIAAGILFALFLGGDPEAPEATNAATRANLPGAGTSTSPGTPTAQTNSEQARPLVLAKIRGPVTESEPEAHAPEAPPNGTPEARSGIQAPLEQYAPPASVSPLRRNDGLPASPMDFGNLDGSSAGNPRPSTR